MAVLKVIKAGDPILRQPTQPVTRITKRVSRLIEDMIETMYAVDGVGLAAPQVGVSKKIAVIDVGEGPIALINPKIIEGSGEDIDVEGCLSVPGKQAYVKRMATVKVQALNEKGKPVQIEAEGLLARALQHEIDHLNGILFTDLVDEKDIFEGEE
ncbi:MAG TPA: peptide deformylase [Limnochordia bacterium]|nr:peptide deformylase [Limnochordia bacterium]HPT92256.1 peptide deformylase [Limnochordia bacterium]HPZ30904.1 peptide deformylase [Limnochordia bacterium]HQD70502.1 peptide deformylase [Limnochordia bacterium]HXK97733.1 peptide deformylase [Limnochordia bacterium]